MYPRAILLALVTSFVLASPAAAQEIVDPRNPDYSNVEVVPFPDFIKDPLRRYLLRCELISVTYTHLSKTYEVPTENIFPDRSACEREGVICGETTEVTIVEASCPAHCQLPDNALNPREDVNFPNKVPAGASTVVFAHFNTYVDFPVPREGKNRNLKCEPK